MENWFGKGCEYLSAQWEDSEIIGGPNYKEQEPVITFCRHPKNPSEYEGNCNMDDCPLEIINKMTYKEKLIKFVKIKDKIIKEKTGINYINELDIQEIREWDEETCKKIYSRFTISINTYFVHDLSIGTCPWCLKSTVNDVHDCKDCEYGKRHGMCDDDGSLFSKYISKWEVGFITNDMYMKILKDIEQ